MPNEAAIKKAKKFLALCNSKIDERNGSKKTSGIETKTLNELQLAIGSQHGLHPVTYNEAKITVTRILEILNM